MDLACEKILFLKQTNRCLEFKKYLSYFVDGIGSRKSWVFLGRFSSYDNSNCFQLFHRLNRFAKIEFFIQAIRPMKIWDVSSYFIGGISLAKINFFSKFFQLRNLRTFQVFYWRFFEVLQLKLFYRRHRLPKTFGFLSQLYELCWNFEFFQFSY